MRHHEIHFILACLALSGCATSAEKMDYTARVQEGGPAACLALTEDDVDTNYGETVTVGAVLGGIVGSVLGVAAGAAAAVGGNDPTPFIVGGAAGGFALGAALGAADGVETADKKEAYALQEAQFDCQIEALEDDNDRIEGLVTRLRSSVAETEQRLANLETEYVAKRISKEVAMKDLAEIDDSSAQMERTVLAMKTKRDAYVSARDKTQTAAKNSLNTDELDRQIDDCSKEVDDCQKLLDRLLERRKVAQFG